MKSMVSIARDDIAEPTLQIGSPAPALHVKQWLKGKPIEAFEEGKVYVIEFWATWCAPCVENIPHLTELARKFDGKVIVVGINVRETEGAAGTVSSVQAFVEKMGGKMDYTVAMDDPTRQQVFTDWATASGIVGIPAAFVVDGSGRIAWMGHPMGADSDLGSAVAMAVEGTLDLDAMKRKQAEVYDENRYYRMEAEAERFNREMLESKNYRELAEAAERNSLDPDIFRQGIGRQQFFLANAFLKSKQTSRNVESILAKDTEDRFDLLLSIAAYADLLPPVLVNGSIEKLKEKDDPESSGFLADIYYQIGRYPEALDYLDRYIKFVEAAPEDAQNEGYLYGLKRKREKFEAAIKASH